MRIAICGSFGVGKTTLINSIEFENKIVDLERNIENMSPLDNPVEFNLAVFNSIIGNENKYRNTNKSFITNCSHIDNLAYMLKFSHSNYLFFEKEARQYDLIFYIPIEFPLEKDGYRYEDENLRREIDSYIKQILNHFTGLKYVLKGSNEDRVKQFYTIIKEYEKKF